MTVENNHNVRQRRSKRLANGNCSMTGRRKRQTTSYKLIASPRIITRDRIKVESAMGALLPFSSNLFWFSLYVPEYLALRTGKGVHVPPVSSQPNWEAGALSRSASGPFHMIPYDSHSEALEQFWRVARLSPTLMFLMFCIENGSHCSIPL